MDRPGSIIYSNEFLQLKKEIEAETGFTCYEVQPGDQTTFFGTSDKYEALQVAKELHRAVVRIATSSEAPLKESEWSALCNKVNDLMGTDDTLFIQAQDNRLKEEIAIMLVGVVQQEEKESLICLQIKKKIVNLQRDL